MNLPLYLEKKCALLFGEERAARRLIFALAAEFVFRYFVFPLKLPGIFVLD